MSNINPEYTLKIKEVQDVLVTFNASSMAEAKRMVEEGEWVEHTVEYYTEHSEMTNVDGDSLKEVRYE